MWSSRCAESDESSGFAPVRTPAARVGRSARLGELDGLRGWAALSVVCFHLFWETFGAVAPGFRNPITAFLFDGNLAVSIFFLLSGEALSSGYFAGNGRACVFRLVIRRYPRLTIPILATSLIVFAICRSGLAFNAPAALIVGREDWLATFLNFPMNVSDVLRYSFFSVYTSASPPKVFDPFLWTMQTELIGSAGTFIILLSFSRFRYPWLELTMLTTVLSIFPQSRNLACFPAGIAIAFARRRGVFATIQQMRASTGLSWAMIAFAAGADSLLVDRGVPDAQKAPFLALLLVLAVFCNRHACGFLVSAPSRWLGRLSFPLYLMQFPVLVSFTSGAIVFADRHGRLSGDIAGLIAMLSVAICIAAAVLFQPVESLTRRVGDRLVALAGERRLQSLDIWPAAGDGPAPGAATDVPLPP